MAVEKMEMLNLVGSMEHIDDIARKLILSSLVHMVNAITEIQHNNFSILHAKEKVDALIDYNYIKQYSSTKQLAVTEERIRALEEIFEIKTRVQSSHVKERYNFDEDKKVIDEIYERLKDKHEGLEKLKSEFEELDVLGEYLSCMKNINIELSEAIDMNFIKIRLGKLSKYDMDKLKNNYENIPAIVLKLSEGQDTSKVLIFVPESVEIEVDRVLKSLNFDEYVPALRYSGTPQEWLQQVKSRKIEIMEEERGIKSELQTLKAKYESDIGMYYSRLMMEYKVEELKSHVACTNDFFYLTGWVPASKKKMLMESLKEYEESLIVVFKEIREVREGLEPPTCMRNNKLLKPFESVVRMYGLPSYRELDPTAFLGISYMLLFGAMFGDVGQGMVLFLAGEFLHLKKGRSNLGGVISRLGISSTLFGFLYGSIFGFEDIISGPIVKPIKPMENINLMLISAIVFGVILLTIGFLYNLANSYKNRDVENGLLSRNGLAGLLFYWILLYFILTKVNIINGVIPDGIVVVMLVLLLGVMLLKEPLANLIKGVRPLYSESKADYYIEGGFGVVETLLSLFSNTLSFIRVGAFAINHVGLFVAFETLSEMMTNRVEGILIIILGNIVIIGLEGLIVFIQGLRLEYYELFSKYYVGGGYEYKPFYFEYR